MELKRSYANSMIALTIAVLILNSVRCDTWARPELPVHNVDTGLEYATIQEAINANETLDGHTVRVDAGTYYEQVILNKSLSLMGQDKYTTIIDGNGSQAIIQVTARNVTVTGFTLQNTTAGYGAVQLYNSQDNNISDNIMENTYYGIHIYNSRNNNITNNQALDNSYSGVYLYFSEGNVISECDFSSNVNAGVFLFNSIGNEIRNNTISRQRFGISLTDSDTNVIHDNDIFAVEQGIHLSRSNNNLVHSNNGSGCDHGIYLGDSNNNTVSENSLSLNEISGIFLDSSINNILLNNILQNNTHAGVYLSLSSNNTLSYNTASANEYGIHLSKVDNCTFSENEVAQNMYGIVLSESADNWFWYNKAQENGCGMQFDRSNNNTMLDNNFINNTQQLTSINSTNYLDNGVEGNYWDNYNGTDANQDAIGDTPFNLAEDNIDNRPLMGTFSRFIITFEENDYYIDFICNSTISEILYDSTAKIMNFSVTGLDGASGFCRLPVPKILISAPQVVLVDGINVNATSLQLSNGTHAFLYFTYSLSIRQVTIISKTQYDLLKEYNTLLTEYLNLNSTYQVLLTTYNTLVASYNALGENYTQLQSNYGSLNVTYYQLTGNYEILQNSYNTLSTQYTSLNSTHNSLLTSFEELNLKYNNAVNEINTTRNLTYALTASMIIIAAILLSTNIMFRRRINKQNRIIEAYNPLELARTLFMEDVKSRGAKIDKFQSKYGVKIQTRNNLEDVIKNLEKEKKK